MTRTPSLSVPRLVAKPRAFTLIEVAVTTAIAGVIVAVASTMVVQIMGAVRIAQVRIQADEEAKLLGEWLVFQMRGLGGDELRPWQSIAVDNDCGAVGDLPACDGSDRITVTVVDPNFGSCRIGSAAGANLISDLIDSPPLGNGDGLPSKADDTCCLDVFKGAATAPSPWEGRQAQLIDGADDSKVFPLSLGNRTSANGDDCAINVPGNLPAGATPAGGRLVIATQKTFFRSPVATAKLQANTLYEFVDRNFDNIIDDGELTLIADNVYDLQLSMGYDQDGNGRIDEDASASDEWQYNATTDPIPIPFDDKKLRQLATGIVVGVPITDRNAVSEARLLDGPTRRIPGVHLRGTLTRATMRNIFLFD